MSVQECIDLLMDIEDKSMEVMIPTEIGFVSACPANSDVAETSDGRAVFVVNPCFCHIDDSEEADISLDVHSDDFEELNLN